MPEAILWPGLFDQQIECLLLHAALCAVENVRDGPGLPLG